MLQYKAIEILTSEQARAGKSALVDAVIDHVRGLKIAARCIVTRGIAGCYESGEVATGRLEVLSFNLPVRITIVLPAAAVDRVLDPLADMVEDGIVLLHDLHVVRHHAKNAFLPRQLMVRDVMTVHPRRVLAESPLGEAARILLSSVFTGLPVVDEKERPVGVVSQSDLVQKAGLPIRTGLLARTDPARIEAIFNRLSARPVSEVMTSPAIVIQSDRLLSDAVRVMLEKDVKRLPVVDALGRLTGVLSRVDIFRTVMREAPDWKAFRGQEIEVANLRHVADILRRDTHTVGPETPLDQVIRAIDKNDIQRVAVVDREGKLLGLISDGDLLRYFREEETGIWRLLTRRMRRARETECPADLQKCLVETPASAVMTRDLITVTEETLIEEAISLMVEKALKRLPVVDDKGRFKGMISRDSLLRTGFGGPRQGDEGDAGI